MENAQSAALVSATAKHHAPPRGRPSRAGPRLRVSCVVCSPWRMGIIRNYGAVCLLSDL